MNYKILKPQQPDVKGYSYYKKYRFYFTSKSKNILSENISIIGEIDLNDCIKNNCIENDCLELIYKNGNVYQFKINPLTSEVNDQSLLIYVGDNEFLLLKNKKNVLFNRTLTLVVFITLFGALGVGIFGLNTLNLNHNDMKNTITDLKLEDTIDWNGEYPMNNNKTNNQEDSNNISIPGYSSLIISSENQYVDLINPTQNDVYFKYIIDINEKNIFTSNLIPPGKSLRLNVFDILPKGEYISNFNIETYDISNMGKCNGANQNVKLEIK